MTNKAHKASRAARPAGNRNGFTLIELLVVIAIIALLIGILLPALGQARTSARKLQSGSNQRQVVAAMAIFADTNNGFFPGVEQASNDATKAFADADDIEAWTAGGQIAGHFIPARYLLMLQDEFLTSEVIVSPAEPLDFMPDHDLGTTSLSPPQNTPAWTGYSPGGWVFPQNGLRYDYNANTAFYSYAMLDLHNTPVGAPLRHVFQPLVQAWSLNHSNADAPVISDRLIFWTQQNELDHETARADNDKAGMQGARQSLWTPNRGGWEGHVGFSDGHVAYSNTSILQRTNYAGYINEGDNNANNNTDTEVDRSGDDLFQINSGMGAQTRDAGMVVRSGSQTYRFGGATTRR